MKDLFNHQNSMVFGVKKIQRRHCRAFLKDQIPNHILLDTLVTFTTSRHAAADSGLIQTEVVNLYRHVVSPNSELSQVTHSLCPPRQVSQCISRTANVSQMSLFLLFPRLSPRLIEL